MPSALATRATTLVRPSRQPTAATFARAKTANGAARLLNASSRRVQHHNWSMGNALRQQTGRAIPARVDAASMTILAHHHRPGPRSRQSLRAKKRPFSIVNREHECHRGTVATSAFATSMAMSGIAATMSAVLRRRVRLAGIGRELATPYKADAPSGNTARTTRRRTAVQPTCLQCAGKSQRPVRLRTHPFVVATARPIKTAASQPWEVWGSATWELAQPPSRVNDACAMVRAPQLV